MTVPNEDMAMRSRMIIIMGGEGTGMVNWRAGVLQPRHAHQDRILKPIASYCSCLIIATCPLVDIAQMSLSLPIIVLS